MLRRKDWLILVGLILFVAFVTGSIMAQSGALITGVKVMDGTGELKVLVGADSHIRYNRPYLATKPRLGLVMDVYPARLSENIPETIAVNRGLVESVHVTTLNKDPGIVRITVDLISPVDYKVVSSPEMKGVHLIIDAMNIARPEAEKEVVQKAAPKAIEAKPVEEKPVATKQVVSKPVVAKPVEKPVAKPVAKPAPVVVKSEPKPVVKQEVAKEEELSMNAVSKPALPKPVVSAPAPVVKVEVVEKKEPKKVVEMKPAPKVEKPVVQKPAVVQKEAPKVELTTSQVAKAAKPRVVIKREKKKISLDVVDMNLIDFLRLMAKEMNMNLVADPSVQGTLTVSLKDVTPEGALALILKMSGYSYKRVDNTLIVGPEKVVGQIAPNIMDDPSLLGKQVTFNVALDKAPPEKVAQAIQGYYGEQIKVVAVPGINEIAITAPESKVREIRKKVAEIDVPDPDNKGGGAPVELVEMPIQLKFLKIKDIKDALATVAPGIQPLYDTNLNLVILRGTQEQVTKAKNYLGTLESSSLRQLIRLDVKVVDLTERGSKELGVTWGGVDSGQPGILDPIELQEVQPTAGQIGIGYFARSATALQATINFLVSNGEARIVASPSLIVLSGNEAKIEVGETYPFVFQDPRSGQYQLQNIDYTTKLKITPTASMAEYSITDPDKVMLEVNVDVADLRGTETSLGIPVRGTKMVDTKVIVRHTETLVIGGLISVDDSITTRKVPLLGDLPIVGRMFTQDSHQKTNREVVIMITPTLLRDGMER